MSLLANARSQRRPRVFIGVGVMLLLVAFVAALWPRAVTYNGVRRSCSPQIGDFVPSDPGPGYPVGLDIECGDRSQPERITMLVCGALGTLTCATGLWLHQRRRLVSRWTPLRIGRSHRPAGGRRRAGRRHRNGHNRRPAGSGGNRRLRTQSESDFKPQTDPEVALLPLWGLRPTHAHQRKTCGRSCRGSDVAMRHRVTELPGRYGRLITSQ